MKSYFDITIQSQPSDVHHFLGKVYRVLHGILSDIFKGKVGISFPEWSDHEFNIDGEVVSKGEIGRVIRLFGNTEDLVEIRRNPALDHYAERQAIRIGIIEAVSETEKFILFIRDRRKEKQTAGFRRRSRRRDKKRALAAPFQKKEYLEKPKPYTSHYIPLLSSSNGHPYSLSIRKEYGEHKLGEFNRYGLSKEKSSLPDF